MIHDTCLLQCCFVLTAVRAVACGNVRRDTEVYSGIGNANCVGVLFA